METTIKIQKWGNSHGIRLPKVVLDAVQWKENDTIEIIEQNGSLLLKPIAPKRNLLMNCLLGIRERIKQKK